MGALSLLRFSLLVAVVVIMGVVPGITAASSDAGSAAGYRSIKNLQSSDTTALVDHVMRLENSQREQNGKSVFSLVKVLSGREETQQSVVAYKFVLQVSGIPPATFSCVNGWRLRYVVQTVSKPITATSSRAMGRCR